MSKEFIAEAAQRASGDDMPLWRVQRDQERADAVASAESAKQKQAAFAERREELMTNVGTTFKERIGSYDRVQDPNSLAKDAMAKAVSPETEAFRRDTFKSRVGTGLATVEPHDSGLDNVQDAPSRLDATLRDVREQREEASRQQAEKQAAQAELFATTKEAWKRFPADTEPVPSPDQAEWSGDDAVSQIVIDGRRSKEDILQDPTPRRIIGNPSTKE